ncbi:hypothetical protein Glove_16g215 [Diversispora epigaea]|uniref:Uncharacterized protein n=1 Tax=Diversispora epigaea TaxID=1348612 RepID=A0A397JLM3_9GLOM|nr:hypothetical protein Glove_16g215 [Diversispora epigaea]
MDPVEKINDNIPVYTDNPISDLSKAITKTVPKISNEININKTNRNNILDTSITLENVLSNLTQQGIPNTSSDKSNSQILIPQKNISYISGGIELMSYKGESASFPNMEVVHLYKHILYLV